MANIEGASGSEKPKTSAAQKAQKAKKKAQNAKKQLNRLKSIKALAPLVTALGYVAIALVIIFLIIGFIGFFTTLPGLAVDKFLEACSNFWKWMVMDDSISINDDQIDELAAYVEDMGYNLEAYGFVSPGMVERSGNNSNSSSSNEIHVNNEDSKIKNLYAYVLANERTYTIQHSGGGGFLVWLTSWIPGVNVVINKIDSSLRSAWVDAFSSDTYFGLIRVPNSNDFDVEIDRDNNEMLITNHSGLFGYIRDQMKWDLSGWTSRYGKPIELSLALHLSTMAPDFVYDFCMDEDIQAVVNIETHKVEYNVDYNYYNNGKTITKQQIDDVYKELVDIIPTYEDIEHLYTNVVVKQFSGREADTYLFNESDGRQGTVAPVPIDVLYKTNLIKIWEKDERI